jgi:hypothetical protein
LLEFLKSQKVLLLKRLVVSEQFRADVVNVLQTTADMFDALEHELSLSIREETWDAVERVADALFGGGSNSPV